MTTTLVCELCNEEEAVEVALVPALPVEINYGVNCRDNGQVNPDLLAINRTYGTIGRPVPSNWMDYVEEIIDMFHQTPRLQEVIREKIPAE